MSPAHRDFTFRRLAKTSKTKTGAGLSAAWIKARDPQQRKVVEKASDGRNLRSPSDDDWLLHLNRLDP